MPGGRFHPVPIAAHSSQRWQIGLYPVWAGSQTAVMSLDPTSAGWKRWTVRWKPALDAFEIAFDGRLAAGRQ